MTVRAPGALLIWGLLSAGVAPLVAPQPPDRRAQQPSREQPPDRVPERQPPPSPPPAL